MITFAIQCSVTLDCLDLHERAIRFAYTINKLIKTAHVRFMIVLRLLPSLT